MRFEPPRRSVSLLLLAGLLVLAGCGSGGDAAASTTSLTAGDGFLPTAAMDSARSAVFLIRAPGFPTQGGSATVHFDAVSGTPFFDGTASTFTAAALIELPGQMRGSIPPVGIPHTIAGPVLANVRVQFADGSFLGGAPLEATFAPLPPPPPPRVLSTAPGLLLSGTPTCFTVRGTSFEPVGGTAMVQFTAESGTPFQGGSSATLTVPATIESDTLVRGVIPGSSTSADAQAFVTVQLPGGASPTSPNTIANFGAERKVIAGDGAGFDFFGTAVSISGDTAVVGARLNDTLADKSGAAYVFIRQGTAWILQQKLTAPDGGQDDQFGTAVAIDGDTVAIGAPFEDEAAANGGSVYVFVRSGATWTFQDKLMAGDAASGDHLGESVSLRGDLVAAGAPDENNGSGTDAGSVYVFQRTGTIWSEQQKLLTGSVSTGGHFGQSVAISPATLVVGAPEADMAFAYTFDGSTWGGEQALVAPGILAGDDYGRSVDIADEVCIVGAPLGDGAVAGSGVAHVFARDLGTWSHAQALAGAGGTAGDEFGWSVAIDGGFALVGALEADVAASNAGAAYPFQRMSPGTWTAAPVLTAGDASSSDRFGQAVDLSGCVGIVGAHLENNANGIDAGAIYVK